MSNLYRGPSIDATYHVSVHLAKRFQSRRCFRNRPISNKNCLCRPCLLTDPKLAIFMEGLPQMLPTTFRFIWPSGFRVEDFLGIDQSATRIACAGHVCQRIQNEQSFATYQVHLGKRLRGEDFQKSTNQKQELPVAAMFVNGSVQNEHTLQRTAHRCFLLSFGSWFRFIWPSGFTGEEF